MTSRAEHMRWCKARALEYVEHDDLPGAVTSTGQSGEPYSTLKGTTK